MKALFTTDLVYGTEMALHFQFILIAHTSGCTAVGQTTEKIPVLAYL